MYIHPISKVVATVATVSGAVPRLKRAVPPAAIVLALRVSTAYLKINGTPTFKTFAPMSKPTASLTLCLIAGSS